MGCNHGRMQKRWLTRGTAVLLVMSDDLTRLHICQTSRMRIMKSGTTSRYFHGNFPSTDHVPDDKADF